MRIEREVPLIFRLNIGRLTWKSMGVSPKIAFSSHISLQNAFINPIGGLYKRLFPLGHKVYLSFYVKGLKTRNLRLVFKGGLVILKEDHRSTR